MKKTALFLLIFFHLSFFTSTITAGTFYSPTKKVSLELKNEHNILKYSIRYNGNKIISSSDLCWKANGKILGNNISSIAYIDEGYFATNYPNRGSHAQSQNKYHAITTSVYEANGINYQIEFRIYDSGIAFRYMLIQEELTEIDDFTTFYLPDNCSCWIQDNIVSYEGKYKSFLSGELPLQTVAGPPITIKYPSGIYAAITEGGVTNFSGMGLSVISPNGFQSRLDGNTVLAGSIATPWRIIMTGTLTDLVNNDIISDVSAPLSPVFNGKTDWIKTGNCLWSWLTGYDVTFENMKKFVDWAKELHIPYVLVDEGWSHWKDKQKGLDSWQLIKKLCDYARKKGVKIIVWKSFPTRKGIEGIESPDLRYRFLSKCKEAGISGVKLDFFNSENQKITRYYEETLKEAAEIGLVVIFHGSNKPTGLERTYPNEISRESIRGMESGADAVQNTITPFTRLLAGHADYTPLFLSEKGRNGRNWKGNTTEAHQIASTAVFLSPLRCYSGRPEDYIDHPAKEIFLDIPVSWDETIVLPPSEIGDCVVMARRKNDTWYIAALTHQAKKISVSFPFLKRGVYNATIISDAPNRKCSISIKSISRKNKLDLNVTDGGGFLIKLIPINKNQKK